MGLLCFLCLRLSLSCKLLWATLINPWYAACTVQSCLYDARRRIGRNGHEAQSATSSTICLWFWFTAGKSLGLCCISTPMPAGRINNSFASMSQCLAPFAPFSTQQLGLALLGLAACPLCARLCYSGNSSWIPLSSSSLLISVSSWLSLRMQMDSLPRLLMQCTLELLDLHHDVVLWDILICMVCVCCGGTGLSEPLLSLENFLRMVPLGSWEEDWFFREIKWLSVLISCQNTPYDFKIHFKKPLSSLFPFSLLKPFFCLIGAVLFLFARRS